MNASAETLAGKQEQKSIPGNLRHIPSMIRDSWRTDLVALRNWWRQLRGASADYVIIRLAGPLPERSGPPRSFFQRFLPLPPQALAIETVNGRMRRIADADNVRGVVIIMGDLAPMGLARLQNLRRCLLRFRQSGKEVVVYSPYQDLAHYYIASAGDLILAPPGAQFDVVGLRSEAVFLRDALHMLGIEAEVLQVSPYKTAGNILSQADITPEQRQQMEWLLDDNYEVISSDLAEARQMPQSQLQSLIDAAPFSAEEAVDSGLIDAIIYEDQLPAFLGKRQRLVDAVPGDSADSTDESGSQDRRRAKLVPWTQARSLLMERVRQPSRRYVGVVTIEGVIAMGPGRQPPVNLPIPLVGGAVAGEETIVQLLRQAESDDNMAALILHVESGGGSSLASELIWRQVQRVATRKPVLAYMGDVAASGGYFVSAGAKHIMCQRGTLTGSIGVLLARMNLQAFFEKIEVNRASVRRGAHAGIYTESRPLHPDERDLLWNLMQETYEQFKYVVRQARGLEGDALEAVAGGRVWTGRQARERQLVDSHGDFIDAVNEIAALAGITVDDHEELRVRNLFPRAERYIPPQSNDLLDQLANVISMEHLRAFNGRALSMIPFDLRLF